MLNFEFINYFKLYFLNQDHTCLMESYSGIKDKESGKIVYIYCNDITNPEFYLGEGQYGAVFKGMHFNQDTQEPGEFVAIKKILLGKKND